MKVIITKWGLLKFHPILEYYVEWDWIENTINRAEYIVSIWFFRNLSKMFKKSYVLYYKDGMKNKKDIIQMINRFEEKEGITLTPKKKKELFAVAIDSIKDGVKFSKKKHTVDLKEYYAGEINNN